MEPQEPLTQLGGMELKSLPSSMSSFIARHSERQDLRSLLRGSRLVTLTSSDGVGKTRLLRISARDSGQRVCRGIWFVDLASIVDGRLIPHLTAETLRLKELPFQEQRHQVLRGLRESLCLILLDTCETRHRGFVALCG